MPRAQSDATALRNLKRSYAELAGKVVSLHAERDQYRARATKAEQEVAEWKARFDVLLRRDGDKNKP